MTQRVIDTTSGAGDPRRAAFYKANLNFDELYPAQLWETPAETFFTNAPDYPPTSPNAMDDEFATGSTIDTAKWTWVNQGAKTAPVANSHVSITAPSPGSGDNWGYVVQALPASPSRFRAKLRFHPSTRSNFVFGAMILRDSGTGRTVIFGPDNGALRVSYWTSPTSFSSSPFNTAYGSGLVPAYGRPLWLEIEDNGTNFIFRVSYDGVTYQQLLSASRTAWLASPNQIGLGGGTNIGSGNTMVLAVDYFRRVA